MPSPEEIFEELEEDRGSREAEVRLIERLMSLSTDETEKGMFKRSMILLTYAHLEGYCKFSLAAYVRAINASGIRCREASPAIAAATLSKVFAALRDPQSKHDVFRRTLPDDSFLHLVAREQIFIEEIDNVVSRTVEIPDRVIDTKSNVDASVLMKLLFQVGLNYDLDDNLKSNLNRLLGVRNAIAHGDRLKIPSDRELADYMSVALETMSNIQTAIYQGLTTRTYLKQPA